MFRGTFAGAPIGLCAALAMAALSLPQLLWWSGSPDEWAGLVMPVGFTMLASAGAWSSLGRVRASRVQERSLAAYADRLGMWQCGIGALMIGIGSSTDLVADIPWMTEHGRLVAGLVLGSLWVLAFVALAANYIRLAIEPQPLIVVDSERVFDRTSMKQPLPWSEVRSVRIDRSLGEPWIQLTGGDLSSYMRWSSRLFGRTDRITLTASRFSKLQPAVFVAVLQQFAAAHETAPIGPWGTPKEG